MDEQGRMEERHQWSESYEDYRRLEEAQPTIRRERGGIRSYWPEILALSLASILIFVVFGKNSEADQNPPTVFYQVAAPFHASVGCVVTWSHKNPNDPSQYWAYYTHMDEVQEGQIVYVGAEGHPAHVIVAFTEIGGPRYQEYTYGKYPWEIFSDGFENGNTSNWSEVVP